MFSIAKVGKIAGRAPQQRMHLTPAIGKAGTGVRREKLTWVRSHQEVRAYKMFEREFRLRLKTAWAVEALEKQASASSEVLCSAGREDVGTGVESVKILYLI